MSTKKKRIPRPVALNTLALATAGACKLTKLEADQILSYVHRAAACMRTGIGSHLHYKLLAGHIDVARAIEDKGVVHGLADVINAADAALQRISTRAVVAGEWTPPTLYANEITALTEFATLHDYQVRQCSWSEYRRAVDRATGQITAAGATVDHAHTLAEFGA